MLDLGSGGGIDVLLSAKRVSPGGKAYGLDMTDEMLELAEKNKAEAGAENVEFLKGHIEEIPLPEDHVDVVISNCVINLSTDKPKVISEAFRVLKPGGRFAVSDMVFLGDKGKLPAELVRSMEAWSGCVSGALEKDEYERLLEEAGFEDVSVEVTHTYEEEFAEASGCCGGSGCCGDTATTAATTAAAEVPLASAFIRGRKPAGRDIVSTKELGVVEENGVRRDGYRGRGGPARRPGPRPLGPHTGEDALHDGRRAQLLRLLRLRRARRRGGGGHLRLRVRGALRHGPVEGLLPHEEAQGRGVGAARSGAGSGPSTPSTGRPPGRCSARPPIACSPSPEKRGAGDGCC